MKIKDEKERKKNIGKIKKGGVASYVQVWEINGFVGRLS